MNVKKIIVTFLVLTGGTHLARGALQNANKSPQEALAQVEKIKRDEIRRIFIKSIADSSVRQSIYNLQAGDTTNYQTLMDSLKRYSLLFTAQDSISIKNVQLNFIKEKQAIIDYFVTDSRLQVFVITKHTFDFISLNVSRAELAPALMALVTPLYNTTSVLQLQFDKKLAHRIYRQIFEPLEKFLININTIIIIPDDILLGFPFELLITDLHQKDKKINKKILYDEYRTARFLINKYAISYNFLLASLSPTTTSLQQARKLGRKLLTISNVSGIESSRDSSVINWTLTVPRHGNEEALRVARLLWRHKNLTGTKASKKYFLNKGEYYRWFYLAIPGQLNNLQPHLSNLLFSYDRDSLLDNKLTISDIMGCKLYADLITINGTELKPVQSLKKSGVLGLPQAFLFSGAKSVIFSLWRIRENAVVRFMTKLYWELKYKRQTNSFALQQAKLAALKDTFEFDDKEISRAHPYFWASFILVGDPNVRPPTFSTIPPRMVIVIAYLVVFVVSLIIVRKTINRDKRH